ncbi:hypothetical protein [Methylorubrum thiocyanatum]|uniref:hypothetical protein n=1 Tax=Methylorubrum thiocyanatum TaxID=47958 RepID=UPI003F81DB0A
MRSVHAVELTDDTPIQAGEAVTLSFRVEGGNQPNRLYACGETAARDALARLDNGTRIRGGMVQVLLRGRWTNCGTVADAVCRLGEGDGLNGVRIVTQLHTQNK